MSEKTTFFLAAWRKRAGMTQAQLAEASGYSQNHISQLESGSRRYNQDILETLCVPLNCKPADLLREPNEETAASDPDLQKVIKFWPELRKRRRSTISDMAEGFAETDKAKFEGESE